jgi:hypothetical protein
LLLLHVGRRSHSIEVLVLARVDHGSVRVLIFTICRRLYQHSLELFGHVHEHICSSLLIDIFANEPDEAHILILV